MYTEGNPASLRKPSGVKAQACKVFSIREKGGKYGDASGNFLIPLLMAAMAVAVTVVAITAAVAITAGLAIYTAMAAVANYAMTAGAMAQTAAIATAAFAANAAIAAFKFAMLVNPFGTVGAGIGFAAGAANTGTLKGALAGAEIGFKVGTVIKVAVYIVAGGWYMGTIAGAIAQGMGFAVGSFGSYAVGFTMSGLYGEFAKAIGRNIGGHWVPKEKSLANSFNKHGYNKKAAYRGEAAADFLNNVGSISSSINSLVGWNGLDDPSIINLEQDFRSPYLTDRIAEVIIRAPIESAMWSGIYGSIQNFGVARDKFDGQVK